MAAASHPPLLPLRLGRTRVEPALRGSVDACTVSVNSCSRMLGGLFTALLVDF